MRSLRRRAIWSGIGVSVLSLLVGAVILVTSVDDIALRRFDTDLAARHLQVTVAVLNSGMDPDLVAAQLSDPLYDRPYSGRYWQIIDEDGSIATSRSLFDAVLTVPAASPDLHFANGAGPEGEIRLAWRRITPDGEAPIIVAVGQSLTVLSAERWEVRRSLMAGFVIVGLLGLLIAIVQTSAILRPLAALRHDISRRWDRNEVLDPEDYPEEVSPLVRDINTLLDRNRDIIERSRRQGADLAHALKTPSAILRNELGRFEQAGQPVEVAQDALARIDAQLARSLTRVRAANLGAAAQLGANLRSALARLERAFATVFATKPHSLRMEVPADLRLSMDAQDLEELMGNLLENALKFGRGQVLVTAHRAAESVVIRVEDDGPGIPEADRTQALRPGGRLDTATRGTGLGLAIASDLVSAYGGSLSLGQSATLGGLQVECDIPLRRGL